MSQVIAKATGDDFIGGLFAFIDMRPIIHLFGDRVKAQRFVVFAQKKLHELKALMRLTGLKMQNRMFRFASDDLYVYIESYHGIDKIMIEALVKEAEVTRKTATGSNNLPLIDLGSSTLGIIGVQIRVYYGNANFMEFTFTGRIWDSDGNVVYSNPVPKSFTGRHVGPGFLSITLDRMYFDPSDDYYYGLELVLDNNPNSESLLTTRPGTALPNEYTFSGGAWVTDEHSAQVVFEKMSSPVLVGNDYDGAGGGVATLLSPSKTTSKYAVKISNEMIIPDIQTAGIHINPAYFIGKQLRK